MPFEPWMFVAMEDEGILETCTGRINRVTRFLAEQKLEQIGMEEVRQACETLNMDPDYFDQEDLVKIECMIRQLWGR